MNELEDQVRRAYRRLGFQRFLVVLAWCWSGTLLVALVLIGIDRFLRLGVPEWGWGAGALGLGLAAAGLWTLVTRRRELDAAIEIDRRFKLKERVSSTLAMAPAERETEAGRALVQDAVRRVKRIDVASRFQITPRRQFLLPLLPGVLAIVVALIPPLAGKQAGASPGTVEEKQRVIQSTKTLRDRLAEQRKKAEQEELEDAEGLFNRLDEALREMTEGKLERKEALQRLQNLSREVQQRREQLGSNQIKRQLDQLNDIGQGPAEKLANAMRKGDVGEAVKQLEALQQQLANSELTEEQKEQMANQLEKMKEKLTEMAEANQAAQEKLQEQIKKANEAGDSAKAGELQRQLDQLMQDAPQMDRLRNLANQLGQCAQCMRNGQAGEAADALGQLQVDLQQQLDEMSMLEDAMDGLRLARDQMNCPNCNGAGCEQCRGQGLTGQGGEGQDENPGMGMGAGRGAGPRPEAKDETDTYASRVRLPVHRGGAVIVGMVEGRNVQGEYAEEIQREFEAARQASTDPLTSRNMPHAYREHVEQYLNRMREGE